MHRPSLPGITHERQVPPHAVEQQTPSTQKPDAQSDAAAHAAPGGLGPQLPFTHAAPPTQSALLAQSARQASPLALHMYAPHESAADAAHAPSPSQRAACVTVEPPQDGARQIVPAAYTAQVPVPSQKPVRPQLAAPSSGQSLRGSAPTGMFAQVPTLPSIAHDWQRPEQSEWQQTPSEQKPLLHAPSVVHAPPASISAASCPPAAAPPCPPPPPPLPPPPNPTGSRDSPPPPQPQITTANAKANPAAVLLEPKPFDMLDPVSGI
jgi:hypothetical protein